jgi:hypothetical protein
MILQDELALRFALETGDHRGLAGEEPTLTFDSVGSVYRQLIRNFEKAKDYDLAEDCFCGVMEMKRLDPTRSIVLRNQNFAAATASGRLARFILGKFSILNLYRLASMYGSSYRRALVVLAMLLVSFGVLFPFSGLRMTDEAGGTASAVFNWVLPTHVGSFLRTLGSGLWASVEIATFQKKPTVEIIGKWGRRLAAAEVVAISGQVTLVLLALRRRFRF